MRTLGRPNQFVQLHLDRLGVAVLCVLDDEDHQEGDDRRTRVDDELPGIAEVEQRARREPHQDHGNG